MIRLSIGLTALSLAMSAFAAEPFDDKFRQLDELLPTPTTIRTASGAPGQAYWQQRADYAIRATLDEGKRSISGAETITYHNNSPDTLTTCGSSSTRTSTSRFGRAHHRHPAFARRLGQGRDAGRPA
jgi:predicted secreted protein